MKKYLMEFIGTLFLTLSIGLTGDPLAIGLTLMSMVYLGAHISGAHYNPAVTVAFWIRNKEKITEVFRYFAAQLLGGLAAVLIILNQGKQLLPKPSAALTQSYVIEILFTFILASVILTVATSKKLKGNSIYGFAIGLTLAGIALVGGPISGGVYNPAAIFGPIILSGQYSLNLILLYTLGPVLGGILAAYAFKYLNPKG